MAIIVPFIVLLINICINFIGEAFAFRKALKKQMVREVPELEQPKSKEDAVAIGQVFEEIGFFDYLEEYYRGQNIATFAVLCLPVFLMCLWVGGGYEVGSLRNGFLISLPVFALIALVLAIDYRRKKGMIRKCRDAESISKYNDEECISYFQYFYDIYKDYRQRFLGDQDRLRWQVIRATAAVVLLCLVVIIYTAVYNYMGLGSKNSHQYHWDYQILEDNSAEIVRGYGTEPQVSIPDSLDGHPVSAIGAEVFKENGQIQSIELPDGIIEIGDSAFENCGELKTVVLPDGLKSIGDSAFENCEKLNKAELPDGVKKVGNDAFARCNMLTKMEFPDSFEECGTGIFFCCRSLQIVSLSRQMKIIPDYMFFRCEMLRFCSIPEKIRSIGDLSFYGTGITSIELPPGIRSIGAQAFSDCKNLQSILIPDSLEVMGSNPFACCQSLENVRISDGNRCLKDLDGVLFSADGMRIICYPQNREGTEYVIPEGTKMIGDNAFESCWSLEKVSLPQSLSYIGDEAFYDCQNLKEIHSAGKLDYIGACAFSRCPGLAEEMLPDAETNHDDY